jgi:hypothetical protein
MWAIIAWIIVSCLIWGLILVTIITIDYVRRDEQD